jgi:hypothetical protein
MSSLDRFEIYGSRVVPFYNYFQPAMVLLELGAIDAAAALRVAAELVIDQAFTADSLAASYLDLARRGHAGQVAAERLIEALRGIGATEYAGASDTLRALGRELERSRVDASAIAEPGVLDYVGLLGQERLRARTAKLRVLRRL